MPFVERAISNYKKDILPLLYKTTIFKERELNYRELCEIGSRLEYADINQG
jgi:hypothetical protein